MSVAMLPLPETRSRPFPPLARLTVAQYHRMIQTGGLNENHQVELIEGLLVSKMPHNPPHEATISILLRQLWGVLPAEWIVRIQSSITLRTSEPEPDLAVVVGPETRYLDTHPRARDIGLAIEVAESTLEYDRQTKGFIYAQARIPHYWVVNLQAAQIEAYSHPKAGRNASYRECQVFSLEQEIPLVLGGKEITRFAVRSLLS